MGFAALSKHDGSNGQKSKIFNLLSVIAILSSSKFSPLITKREQDAKYCYGTARVLSNYRNKSKVLHGDSQKNKHKDTPPISITEIPLDLFCFGYSLLTVLRKRFYRCSFTQELICCAWLALCTPWPTASCPLLWLPIMTHFFPFHPNCRNSPWAGITACMTLYPVMLWFRRRRQSDPFSPGENKSVSSCLQLSSTVFLKCYKRGRGKQLKLFNVNYEIGH